MSGKRATHYVKLNHQCRIPKRWISFDTESRRDRSHRVETQTWKIGTARCWTYDRWGYVDTDSEVFANPVALWEWVTEHCRREQRTVIVAHNLGHDVRISQAMEILPRLGWRLEWCNLDRNVSSMTWRSDVGTLVFCDLFTWLPMGLDAIGELVGYSKGKMPGSNAAIGRWYDYCMRDSEIVEMAMRGIIEFIRTQDLGNWQPTGAGMAYATWRHKFMTHQVLVHADMRAIEAERSAMHTGRAEAWRHGVLRNEAWSEVDMRDAYIRIAAEKELPVKLKFHNGAITKGQYEQLKRNYRVLSLCRVRAEAPTAPTFSGCRTLWAVGEYTSWLWDPEVDALYEDGAEVEILEVYVYTSGLVLKEWALWVLGVAHGEHEEATPVVQKWAKHCGRALIGRLSLRCPQWELLGENPEGASGISSCINTDTGETFRMMYVGNQTFRETARVEGKDSLPQITGYVMSECRARLWRAMQAVGLDEIAHVDTDGMLVSARGTVKLREALGSRFDRYWQVKGTYGEAAVYGPRNYRVGGVRKVAGVSRKAVEVAENRFVGERWSSMGSDMANGRSGSVTVSEAEWTAKQSDPRRADAPGGRTRTVPYRLSDQPASESPSSSMVTSGLYGRVVAENVTGESGTVAPSGTDLGSSRAMVSQS